MNNIIHKIPAWGYGFGHREYGEAMDNVVEMMEFGQEYVARLEHARPPEDWSEEEKKDFPNDAVDLVFRRKNDSEGS